MTPDEVARKRFDACKGDVTVAEEDEDDAEADDEDLVARCGDLVDATAVGVDG